jgi:hypothetical protein
MRSLALDSMWDFRVEGLTGRAGSFLSDSDELGILFGRWPRPGDHKMVVQDFGSSGWFMNAR